MTTIKNLYLVNVADEFNFVDSHEYRNPNRPQALMRNHFEALLTKVRAQCVNPIEHIRYILAAILKKR